MRAVICADALPWLEQRAPAGAIVTSLPDADEVGVSPLEHIVWFRRAARLCMRTIEPTSVAVFYQTDRKHDGALMSKAWWLMDEAFDVGLSLLWHKIVLRRGVGKVDLHRPGYSHLIAFGRERKPGRATPDVFECGPVVYANGMSWGAARVAVEFAACSSSLIVDPFCGRGTVLAVADDWGLDSIGVDIDPDQCTRASQAVLSCD